MMVLASIGWLSITGKHGSVSRIPGSTEASRSDESSRACAAQDNRERSNALDNEPVLTMEEKLEYIEKHFIFENFVEDPLGCIRGMEARDAFEVVSIPRRVLVHVRRRLHNGSSRRQVWGLLDELRDVEMADARRSFEKWKSTIKETIKTGGSRIAVERSSLMDRVSKELLGPYLRNLLLGDEDGMVNDEVSGDGDVQETGMAGSHSRTQGKWGRTSLASSQ